MEICSRELVRAGPNSQNCCQTIPELILVQLELGTQSMDQVATLCIIDWIVEM